MMVSAPIWTGLLLYSANTKESPGTSKDYVKAGKWYRKAADHDM